MEKIDKPVTESVFNEILTNMRTNIDLLAMMVKEKQIKPGDEDQPSRVRSDQDLSANFEHLSKNSLK